MEYVHLFSLLFLLAGVFLLFTQFSEQQKKQLTKNSKPVSYFKYPMLWIVVILALLLKLYLAGSYRGFEADINCFTGWADRIYDVGIPNFYESGFCDYPPGYLYILYGIGFLRQMFASGASEFVQLVVLKLPSILCDMGTGILLYIIAKKHFTRENSLLLMLLYLLNPAVVITSSTWGQVDGVLVFGLLLSIYLASNNKVYLSYFVFALTILLKWQALMFTPVLIYATFTKVFLPKFKVKEFFKHFACFIGSLALFATLAVPFGFKTVIKTMVDALSSYRFATVNAFNTYAALDLNWKSLDAPEFSGLATWGTIAILILVAFSMWIYYATDLRRKSRQLQEKDASRFYYIGATIIFCMFMMSTKMHERYLFPALVLLLAAYMVRPKKEFFIFYLVLSLAQAYNIAWVLFYYNAGTYFANINQYYSYAMPIAWITVITFVAFLYFTYRNYISVQVKGIQKRK